jgi:sulfatase modifying factor 1
MKCPKCSTELPDGAKYCPYCGPIGGEVSSKISDSVLMHSTVGQASVGSIHVGDQKVRCPSCGSLITENVRSIKCRDCGTFFCARCELDFRTERKPGEKPFCCDCFFKQQELSNIEEVRKKAEEEKIKADEKKEIIENTIGMKLKLILSGEFIMGEGFESHKVKLTKFFYIGINPVTQREWQAVMGSNPSKHIGADLPVTNVSWLDCHKFIDTLNRKEGDSKYRMPTEAEWEYACRAGSKTKFYFGDNPSDMYDYGWHDSICQWTPQPVGMKKPNTWGLYDMHGNVWEWCEDWYGDYPSHEVSDPTGPSSGQHKIYRGGCYHLVCTSCTSAVRNHYTPDSSDSDIGFRLCKSL